MTKSGTKQAILDLDAGSIVVEWPDQVTSSEFEDIEQWWKIVSNRIKRGICPNGGADDDLDDD